MTGWVLFAVFYIIAGELLSLLIKSGAYLPDDKIKALSDQLKYEPRWMFLVFGGVGALVAFVLIAVDRKK